ncbi:IS66 family transposase [Glaciimonas sp. GG7]
MLYLTEQWHKLMRYIENGTWPIDNNMVNLMAVTREAPE